MNIIVSNKYRSELKNLGINISGALEGIFTSSQIINAFSNYYYERIILDVTAINGYTNASFLVSELSKIFTAIDPGKTIVLLENIPEFNNGVFISSLIDARAYNYAFDFNQVIELYNNPKTYEQAAEFSSSRVLATNDKSRIIGVKNATANAGATTLVYMMYQELSKKYNVKALELNKNDFKYFNNENMKSIPAGDLITELQAQPFPDVILIDQNDFDNDSFIKESIYLLEPSIVKLNKALDSNPNLINELKTKKVVLNRTSISLPKLLEFSKEKELPIFDIIRNVNEKDKINPQVINLLTKLGFDKANNGNIIHDDTEKKKSLF